MIKGTILSALYTMPYISHALLAASYCTLKSFVDSESGLLKSPFRMNPGPFVELRTYNGVN